MSFPLQAKLLQVLQDGEFSRLGGKHDVRVDVRVIAATNRDLEQAVADGAFREDLFFRLNVVAITLPPLRERREEIPLLADYFLKKYSVQYNKPYSELGPEVPELFAALRWPGNIRELENLIKRAVVLGANGTIRKELSQAIAQSASRNAHLAAGAFRHGPALHSPVPAHATGTMFCRGRHPRNSRWPLPRPAITRSKMCRARPHAQAERELIARMLQQTRWNRKETAEILGISYKALLYKIKENGLDKAS
jgi:two-component system response regulator AtoC